MKEKGKQNPVVGGRDFLNLSRLVLGHTQPPIRWVPGLSREQSGRGAELITQTHLALRLKEEKSYTSTPTLGLRSLLWGDLYLYLTG